MIEAERELRELEREVEVSLTPEEKRRAAERRRRRARVGRHHPHTGLAEDPHQGVVANHQFPRVLSARRGRGDLRRLERHLGPPRLWMLVYGSTPAGDVGSQYLRRRFADAQRLAWTVGTKTTP